MAANIDQQNNTVTLSSEITETVIGKNTVFKGNVVTDMPIRVEGKYEGEIHGQCEVEVSPNGSFNGTIECAKVKLLGKLDGTVNCKLFQLIPGCVFTGEVNTNDVVMSEGCVFAGKLNIVK